MKVGDLVKYKPNHHSVHRGRPNSRFFVIAEILKIDESAKTANIKYEDDQIGEIFTEDNVDINELTPQIGGKKRKSRKSKKHRKSRKSRKHRKSLKHRKFSKNRKFSKKR